ncbi:MAG: hypothetical protein ABII90_16045 [Bacteroidota bacterium]
MNLHIGKKIREIVKKSGLSVTEFAWKINYSRRNIYSIFTKESIDTGLLTRIGDVLEHDFFNYYTSKDPVSNITVGEPSGEVEYYRERNKIFKEQIDALTKEVEYLKEINSLLRDNVKNFKSQKLKIK